MKFQDNCFAPEGDSETLIESIPIVPISLERNENDFGTETSLADKYKAASRATQIGIAITGGVGLAILMMMGLRTLED